METSDFLQDEARRCRDNAARARSKEDREFWLNLASRWEMLQQARERETAKVETDNVVHPYFRKRNRAA
jgi:uncharacterized alpha-E superfamily protein